VCNPPLGLPLCVFLLGPELNGNQSSSPLVVQSAGELFDRLKATDASPWYCAFHGTVSTCPFRFMGCDLVDDPGCTSSPFKSQPSDDAAGQMPWEQEDVKFSDML
jgi:hypothetical protein